MPVTLKELATELQISTATVSLALRNSPLIAKATRARVQQLAEKREYVQNYLGRALQSRRTKLIGLLLPKVTASFYSEILLGAGNAATSAGYGLLLGLMTDISQSNDHQIQLMLERDVDALVIADHKRSFEGRIQYFLKRGKPVVYCTSEAPSGCSSVLTDDLLGGRLAMGALIDHGHRKILCSAYQPQRLAGNKLEAAKSGVAIVEYRGFSEAIAKFESDNAITAIAAYSDEEAVELMGQLRQRGLKIPDELSIIGYNDLPICSLPEFQLSTIAQQRSLLGELAVSQAIKQLEDPEIQPTKKVLKPSLCLRNTIRKLS